MLHISSDSDPNSAEYADASFPCSSAHSTDAKPAVQYLFASIKGVRSNVLLATARVTVRATSGRSVTVRALLDQGSEMTFISENLVQTLRSKRFHLPVSISAVGGIHAGTFRYATNIFISPKDSGTPSFLTTAIVLKALTSYCPKRQADLSALARLTELSWADPDPTGNNPVQLVIGANLYSDILIEGVRKGNLGQPFAQNSVLGWIISGQVDGATSGKQTRACDPHLDPALAQISAHHIIGYPSLEKEIVRFWEVEELPRRTVLSPQDEKYEDHFRGTHSRDKTGRYIVRLPFKTGPPIDIGKSRKGAEFLLKHLTRRLHAKPDHEKAYTEFLNEYERLGHMKPAPVNQNSGEQLVYLPHHSVLRENSATTGVRVEHHLERHVA